MNENLSLEREIIKGNISGHNRIPAKLLIFKYFKTVFCKLRNGTFIVIKKNKISCKPAEIKLQFKTK